MVHQFRKRDYLFQAMKAQNREGVLVSEGNNRESVENERTGVSNDQLSHREFFTYSHAEHAHQDSECDSNNRQYGF